MDKTSRVQTISKIKDSSDRKILTEEIMWEGKLQSMDVYNVPLECLVYNKYNGRILSRTKSYESQGKNIDAESKEGKGLIEKFLWDSQQNRNQTTLEDIRRDGQKKVGIITKEGIVIDGNRRVMLLNRLKDDSDKYNYFKAIILPVVSEENPIEIQRLETSYQMGEDEKLGYRPIEKYLKAKELKNQGVDIKDIAKWMGEQKKTIEEYLSVMKVMDDYLEFFDYKGMYTQLDEREDQFKHIAKWLKNFEKEGSTLAFDGYTNGDVDDLKVIAFDYTRIQSEGKDFREIAQGHKGNHLFGNKELWNSFSKAHFDYIEPIRRDEEKVDFHASKNIIATLKDRDTQFRKKVEEFLIENLNEHLQKKYNQKYKNQPEKLIKKAIDAVHDATANKNINNEEVLNQVTELHGLVAKLLQEKDPCQSLKNALNILSSVDVSQRSDLKDSMMNVVEDIRKQAFQLGKQIKRLK